MKSPTNQHSIKIFSTPSVNPLATNTAKFLTLLLSSIFLVACGGDLSESFAGSSSSGTGGTGGSSGGSNLAPVATNVIVTDNNGGNVEVGDVLRTDYTYTDAQNDTEGNSVFQWYSNGEVINGFLAINKSYTVDAADVGKILTFSVSPVATGDTGGDGNNVLGVAVFSNDATVGSPITTSTLASSKTVFVLDNDSVLDTSHFRSMASASIVNCTLSNGSTTKCHELKFSANNIVDGITSTNVDDEAGSFCPTKRSDTNGGIGLYDDATEPGIQRLAQGLWDNMINDGYNIIDDNDNVCTFNQSTSVLTNGEQAKCTVNCLISSADDNITVVHYIPVVPENLETAVTIDEEEAVGTSLDGVPMTGTLASVATNNGNIQALDSCGGHHDPSGYYHWHFVPESADVALTNAGITDANCDSSITQSTTALTGYANDGYPIYAHLDNGDVTPTGLDSCNGHTSPTIEFPAGIYHYHASPTKAPNLPPCLTGASVTTPVTPTFE